MSLTFLKRWYIITTWKAGDGYHCHESYTAEAIASKSVSRLLQQTAYFLFRSRNFCTNAMACKMKSPTAQALKIIEKIISIPSFRDQFPTGADTFASSPLMWVFEATVFCPSTDQHHQDALAVAFHGVYYTIISEKCQTPIYYM